jgi:hypothetical protein
MVASVGVSRQDGFHRIAGVDDFLPLPVAGASCLVTSANFGVISLQAKPGADVLTCVP